MAKTLSLVLPVFNEQENVPRLYSAIRNTLDKTPLKYEIIFIDDGSKDGSFPAMVELRKSDSRVKIIKFRKNFGQTAAMMAGFREARGEIIVAMDSDLQNDPQDIPRLIAKLDEGYDVVSGWRWKRRDTLSKKLFSLFANKFRRWLTGERIHDSGCSLKAYRKECFENLQLHGEMHRYIPALLMWQGFRVGEIKVQHHERKFGKTKYNMKRVFKGFFDLLFIKFWNDFQTRPIHFFGSLAVIQYVLSGLIFFEQIIKAFIIKQLLLGPLFIVGVLFLITGTLTFLFGFLAEIMTRTYFKDRQNYIIETKLV